MNDRSKVPTINDVAEMAGVSKRTVSRVINRSDKVNEETRTKVQAIIEQLQFTPNRQARGLAARRSFLIGLVYDVPTLVHACHIESDSLVDDVARFVDNARLDGVVILPPVSEVEGVAETLNEVECPFVRFSSELSSEPWKEVVTNYLPAITDMTNHLVELGHREMGFISGPKNNISSQKRHETFVQALAQHDLTLPPDMVEEGAFNYESGVKAAERLLSREHRPTAIFAANDEMAFGVMHVAHEMGLKIPDDLSLVGFDGTSFSSFVIPALSTIRRQTDEMAQLGTKKLLALIDEGPDAARDFETMVSPRFVPRKSTGPAPLGQPLSF
jgi:LacI family transcriptional regulator